MSENSTFEDTDIQFQPPNNMVMLTNGVEKLRIDSDGHFGIGTNSPINDRLRIHAEDSSSDKYALKVTNEAGTNDLFSVRNDGAIDMNIGSFNIPKGRLSFNANTKEKTAGIAATDSGSIYGEHDENTETSRFVIHITDNYDDAIVLRTSEYSSGSTLDMVKILHNKVLLAPDSGKVGIGTLNPNSPLTIRASAPSEELISFEDPNGNTKWHISQNLDGNKPGLNFVETGVADGRLFIEAGGNVGIGTTDPSVKLEISGALKVAGTAIIEGNVGIGIVSPNSSLHINTPDVSNPVIISGHADDDSDAKRKLGSLPNNSLIIGGPANSLFCLYWKDQIGNKYKGYLWGYSI